MRKPRERSLLHPRNSRRLWIGFRVFGLGFRVVAFWDMALKPTYIPHKVAFWKGTISKTDPAVTADADNHVALNPKP